MEARVASCLLAAVCLLLVAAGADACTERPNIVMVLVDDLGWADLSYDGSRDPAFVTPTIDGLNREGVRMLSTFTPPLCSPSRSALFSGLYPFRMGTQGDGITSTTDGHIPLTNTILPQKLKELGYKTHLVGKWHQGFCEWEQTPTNRGFDSFLGFYLASGDHFTHFGKKDAYDLRFAERDDATPADVILEEGIVPPNESNGRYSTELFSQRVVDIINQHTDQYGTDKCTPFFALLSLGAIHGANQVPGHYVSDTNCQNIPDIPADYHGVDIKDFQGRRMKCGMMAAVDEGLKNITDALTSRGQWDNTLIAFTSDNGGSWKLGSSNYPLRGGKITLWNGGTLVPSFIYSPNSEILPNQNRDWRGLFYMTDWYPTFYGFATRQSANIAEAQDGVNHWDVLYSGSPNSNRQEFAYINEQKNYHGMLVRGKYKLIVNESRSNSGWYFPVGQEWVAEEDPAVSKMELYDFEQDLAETVNLLNLPKPEKPARPQKEDYNIPEKPLASDYNATLEDQPTKAEYDVETKPVRPDETDPNYDVLLAEYKEDLAAWKIRKEQYDLALDAWKQRKAQYLAALDEWKAVKAIYDAAVDDFYVLLADYEAELAVQEGWQTLADGMLADLETEYWGKIWIPATTVKKASSPVANGYVIPGYTPVTYVWSPGWCDKDKE